jgi:hypothetical protein
MKATALVGSITLLAALLVTPASANAPTLAITAPTGTVFVNQFPYNASVTFTVTHAELKDVNVLNVYLNDVQIWDGDAVGKPFDNFNNCKSNLTVHTSSCSTNGSDVATVTIPVVIPSPGNYSLSLSAKHQNDLGEDEESVAFQLLAVEYPAPPSVANAYINATPALKALSAKKRGCIISQIANEHGQNETYGPKGGPYNTPLIQQDVWSFLGGCS